MELGLQSFCLRGLADNDEVAAAVRDCGLRRIELCAVHTGFDDPEAFGSLAARYRDNGVPVVSVGVNRIGTDRAAAERLFACAKAAGLERMSVDFPIDGAGDALAIADELAERHGVLLGIHNHGGRHWLGSRQALRWAFGRTGTRVGLSLDTAWALDAGEDPVEMVREFADRLHILHLKDFVFSGAGVPEDVIVGTGNLDLGALDRALQETGFTGEAILEYEGDVDNPVPALRACVAKIGDAMSLVTVPEGA